MKIRYRLGVSTVRFVFLFLLCLAAGGVRAEGEGGRLPVVSIAVPDAKAVEPWAAADAVNSAAFDVNRVGPTNTEVTVHYEVMSLATPERPPAENGVDYQELNGSIAFGAGVRSVRLAVVPLHDEIAEPNEFVQIRLLTNAAYVVGVPAVGEAVIIDNDRARIHITQPTNGSAFPAPARIPITAVAVDAFGAIGRVEFYANGAKIGVSEVHFVAPPNPGDPIEHHFDWQNVPQGSYRLTARAVDAFGAPVEAPGVAVSVAQATNLPPRVAIRHPVEGAVLAAPRAIELRADAVDADGVVTSVVFEVENAFRAVDRMPPFACVWSNPPPGEYTLGAVATDDDGAAAAAVAVHFKVTPAPEPPLVSITAEDPVAGEGAVAAAGVHPAPDIGVFLVTRTGPATAPQLAVRYAVGGTASNGLDYARLGGIVTIPPGTNAARLVVVPCDDLRVEGPETVALSLVAAEAYVLGEPALAVVRIEDNDRTNAPPAVAVVAPTQGQVFIAPTPIEFRAEASDPDGRIKRVEFQAGTFRAADTNEPFTCVWRDPPPGEYAVIAKAFDDGDLAAFSEPVRFKVVSRVETAVVSVVATDAEAAEPGYNKGMFKIVRTGAAKDPLQVQFAMGGTASNGVDYLPTPRSLLIPAGAAATYQAVVAIDDKIEEGTETAEMVLLPGAGYTIGEAASAVVSLLDNDPATNQPPKVRILNPPEGAVFAEPARFEILATAEDIDGRVQQVAFFEGANLLGVVPNPLREGNAWSAAYRFLWTNVPQGRYELTAVATDDGNAEARSLPVHVAVNPPPCKPWALRDLPDVYTPETLFVVRLDCRPAEGVGAYAVEDLPPREWAVGAVSEGGAYDAATRKVKFGPFADAQPRVLTYEVTPPAGAFGLREFVGVASADGASCPVGGDRAIDSLKLRTHPADLAPTNFAMVVDEATAYAGAWARGESWPNGPNPIPISFVTRAGALWRSGEAYRFDPLAGPPPNCWVPLEIRPLYPTAGDGLIVPIPHEANTVICELGRVYTSGVPMAVTLKATPEPAVVAYAVEEVPPVGWAVTDVSAGGAFDARQNKIKWVFWDGSPRVLGYSATPPAGTQGVVKFEGRGCFDVPRRGFEARTIGQRFSAPDGFGLPRLCAIVRQEDGTVILKIEGEAGGRVLIEVAEAIGEWRLLEVVTNENGRMEYVVPADVAHAVRFYRVRADGL